MIVNQNYGNIKKFGTHAERQKAEKDGKSERPGIFPERTANLNISVADGSDGPVGRVRPTDGTPPAWFLHPHLSLRVRKNHDGGHRQYVIRFGRKTRIEESGGREICALGCAPNSANFVPDGQRVNPNVD